MNTPAHIALLCVLLSTLARGQTNLDNAIKLFDAQKYEEAKPLFLHIIQESPNNAVSYYYLGRLTVDNDYDKAIEYLEKATELDDLNAKYHLMLGNAYGVKAQNAGIFKKIGAAMDCRRQYERSAQLDPKYTEARSNLIEYYLQAPGIMGGSVEKARAQADTIVMYDPYEGYLKEARIHAYQKERPEEEQSYRKAISVDSKRLTGYQALWSFYMNEKNEAKASELFRIAVTSVDKKAELYYWSGLLYLQQENFGKAREMLHAALHDDSTNLGVYYQLGRVALLSGEGLEQGLTFFQRYTRTEPAKNDPSWAHAHWRMGMIYEKLGKNDSALSEYRKSLDLNPHLEEARKALEALK